MNHLVDEGIAALPEPGKVRCDLQPIMDES